MLGTEGAQLIAAALGSNSSLEHLELAGNILGGHYTAQGFVPDLSGVTALAEALKQNSTLTTLGLRYNKLDAEAAQHLSNALVSNQSLVELHLSNNDLDAEAAKHLSNALVSNQSLVELRLANNLLGCKRESGRWVSDLSGVTALAEALKQNGTLAVLDLRSNHLGDAAKKQLQDASLGRAIKLQL